MKEVEQFSQLWQLWSKCDLCSLYIHLISDCMILIYTHHKSIFNLGVECNLKQKTRPSFGNFGVQICNNWGLAFLLEFVILTVEASHLDANAFQATLMDWHCTEIWLIWPDSRAEIIHFLGGCEVGEDTCNVENVNYHSAWLCIAFQERSCW